VKASVLTSRSLAAIFGSLYLVMGVVTLVLGGGDRDFLGVFPISALSAVISLIAGVVLLYAAQTMRSARIASIGVGASAFVAGVIALAAPNLWGVVHFHGPSCYLSIVAGAILTLAAIATPDEANELDLEDHLRVRA
jgi:hypothetical protein